MLKRIKAWFKKFEPTPIEIGQQYAHVDNTWQLKTEKVSIIEITNVSVDGKDALYSHIRVGGMTPAYIEPSSPFPREDYKTTAAYLRSKHMRLLTEDERIDHGYF
ncbi:hypothetical protein MYOV011v1_p0365 [Vibrio phage 6E35.1a]|nr:hypothetical protein MYOV011v1_p0365 [Vibrio phage 6E35.1a]